MHYRSFEVRAFGRALAGLLMVTVSIAAHANGPGSNMRPANTEPAPGIVLVWDGGGSGPSSGAIGAHPTAGDTRQWNGGWVRPHWGRGRGPHGSQGVPTYWVWVPGSAVFDYPFSDWRGPTGGWGNP